MIQTKLPKANPFDQVVDADAERAQIEEVASLTTELLDHRYPPPKQVLRAVHPKSHGCVAATFKVLPNLPPEYRVGLFAQAGREYRAWVRFSNASVLVRPDTDQAGKHDSRGMAIKVIGAGDETLQPDGGQVSQDFLMINQPAFAFANLHDYLRLTRTIAENDDDVSGFFAPLANPGSAAAVSADELDRIKATLGVVTELQATPVANPLEIQYFSAAPFMFGPDRVMKFSARPRGPLKPQVVPANPPSDYLRAALKKTIDAGGLIEFDFMLQVRHAGEPDLGIENASTVWDEGKHPFVPVAMLCISAPQPILDSPQGLERCEGSVFTPWHCLPEHQPLGSINRLRKAVYVASAEHRCRAAEDPKRGPTAAQ